YLYIPLGGNRRGAVRTYANLLIVMLIGGLWHGAQWNFVLWGGLHGAVLALERWGRRRLPFAVPRPVGWVATTLVVLSGWVFFRAPDLDAALGYFAALFGRGGDPASAGALAAAVLTPVQLAALAVCSATAWCLPNSGQWLRQLDGWK